MVDGDVIFEAEYFSCDEHEGQHHGKARKHCPRDEIRGKDGRVPAGKHRSGEVKTHDGVDTQYEGRSQSGKDEGERLPSLPVFGCSGPAKGENFIHLLAKALRSVAERGEVGHKPRVPEEHRHRKVGTDGEDVPHEGRIEVWPHRTTRVGIGEDEKSIPDASHMDERKQAGTHHGKDRHSLGRAVDTCTPPLAEEQQNGRDERPRVTDTDPPDEVGNIPTPVNGAVEIPSTDTVKDRP